MDLARLPAVGAAASSAGFPSGRRKQRRKQPEEEEDGPSSSFESGYLSLPEEEEGGGGLGSPASALLPPEPSALLLRAKVDFFRKLGYPPAEILSALRKHGPASDTNTILGELVQHAVAAAAAPGGPQGAAKESPTEPQAPPPDAAEPPLLPRGGAARHGTAGTAAASLAERKEVENLRPVVIDGSNVAMSHGDRDVFSCRGILLAVNWFLDRGHTDITVFVPSWRKEQPRPDFPITDQPLLLDLEKRKIVVFTPSRRVGGKRVVCYDDRFIVKLAYESDGVVVSNDTYRDLQSERPEWKKFIEERLLMYSFVNDKFMPPDDPLGRHGPSLDNFLRKKPVVPEHKTQLCPYGKKCTYGVKCKFFHPERLHQHQHRSVADELRAKAQLSPTQGIPMAKEERVSRRSSNEGEKLHSQKASAEKKSPAATQGQPGEGPPYVAGVTTLKGSGYLPHNWYPPPPISLQMDSLGYSSQDQLDSGLGSLESQMLDMWPSHGLRSHEEALGRGSCSQSLAYLGHSNLGHSRSYGQYPPQGYPKGPLGYTSELPPGRGPPHSFPGYTFPADPSLEPGQKYWSEPYPMGSVPHRERPRGPPGPPYDPPSSSSSSSGQWPMPDRFAEERANVRVRLCGIFHPHLVDAVMSRFPQMLDPQQLAAKILTYKSQNPQV